MERSSVVAARRPPAPATRLPLPSRRPTPSSLPAPRSSVPLPRAGPDNADAPPSTNAFASDLPDSVWALKPLWCQPWSIVATGVTAVAVAANVGGTFAGSATAVAVGAWWWVFLWQLPASYADYVASVRSRDDGI